MKTMKLHTINSNFLMKTHTDHDLYINSFLTIFPDKLTALYGEAKVEKAKEAYMVIVIRKERP